jgi:hypothetical protein
MKPPPVNPVDPWVLGQLRAAGIEDPGITVTVADNAGDPTYDAWSFELPTPEGFRLSFSLVEGRFYLESVWGFPKVCDASATYTAFNKALACRDEPIWASDPEMEPVKEFVERFHCRAAQRQLQLHPYKELVLAVLMFCRINGPCEFNPSWESSTDRPPLCGGDG